MITFSQRIEDGNNIYYLNMKEWSDLIQCFLPNPPSTSWQKKKAVNKFNAFIDWYLDYANQKLGSVSYKAEDMVLSVLPIKDIKSNNSLRSFWKQKLYLLRDYVKKIRPEIKTSTIRRYGDEAFILGAQMDRCICSYESLLSSEITYSPHSMSSFRLSLRDILSSANELNGLEAVPKIEDLYARDLKPNVIFQVRQFLELLGKGIIGFTCIKNSLTGEITHKFTQISWDFIAEKNGKSIWKIDFPIRQDAIIRINKWSNRFIHTGVFSPPYIQNLILSVLGQLMMPPKTPIKTYDGQSRISFEYGVMKINNYNALKTDFQTYIDCKMGGAGRVTIEWLPVNKVSAYIVSL